MPSRYQYIPLDEPTDAQSHLALARFRGFINQMNLRAVLSRISQGDNAKNAQRKIDDILRLHNGGLDIVFGMLNRMFHFPAPVAAPTELGTETAVILWSVNGTANRDEASRRTQVPTIPNGTLLNASSGTHTPANGPAAHSRPLPYRTWAEANSTVPSAPRETIVEYDSGHVSWQDTPTPGGTNVGWNNTPTPRDFGEIPIALGSAAAPTSHPPPSFAAEASGGQPHPQRDSPNTVDFNCYNWGVKSQVAYSPTEEGEGPADSEQDEVQSQIEDSPTEERENASDSDHDELYE